MRTAITFLWTISTQAVLSQSFDEFAKKWEDSWQNLEVPGLTLSYKDYITSNLSSTQTASQKSFFQTMDSDLRKLDPSQLSRNQKLELSILQYEVALNLDRIALVEKSTGTPDDRGVYFQSHGPDWYGYLIKLWTSTAITPSEITAYGWSEVGRIQENLRQFQNNQEVSEDAEELYTDDPETVLEGFKAYERYVAPKIKEAMPEWSTPPLEIARGTNPELAQVPGFYRNNTIYFNLFDNPFHLPQASWLYLHEGIPGHHYQVNAEKLANIPGHRRSLVYSGYREGWAAYIEELAHEMEWYQTPEQRISQMRWDLIRSIRLVLDVGINYHGWNDDKALAEWRKAIVDQDDIGRREIARMRRWPAQVLTYKIGAKAFLDLKDQFLSTSTSTEELKEFHRKVLEYGSIPLACVPALLTISKE